MKKNSKETFTVYHYKDKAKLEKAKNDLINSIIEKNKSSQNNKKIAEKNQKN